MKNSYLFKQWQYNKDFISSFHGWQYKIGYKFLSNSLNLFQSCDFDFAVFCTNSVTEESARKSSGNDYHCSLIITITIRSSIP